MTPIGIWRRAAISISAVGDLDELDDLGGLPAVGAEMLRCPGGGLDLGFETVISLSASVRPPVIA